MQEEISKTEGDLQLEDSKLRNPKRKRKRKIAEWSGFQDLA